MEECLLVFRKLLLVRFCFMMCVSCSVSFESFLRACLHGGGRPQMDEVTCGGSPHLSCKRENERLYGQAGYTT